MNKLRLISPSFLIWFGWSTALFAGGAMVKDENIAWHILSWVSLAFLFGAQSLQRKQNWSLPAHAAITKPEDAKKG